MSTESIPEPWLVVIDPQQVFADPLSEWGSPMFAGALPAIRDLLATTPAERTIITRWVPQASEARVGSWRDYFEAWPFADRAADDDIFDLVDVTDARGGEGITVVDAPTFGKWQAIEPITGAAPVLRLAGVATDCCVLSTALAAADAGAYVEVLAAACAGSTPAAHADALRLMGAYAPQITVVA